MIYQTTLLEDWIRDFYYDIGIYFPHQLDIHEIIYRKGMSLTYMDISSRFYKNEVIIDERLSKEEQWEEFGHELCHSYRHYGNQINMPDNFIKLQEFQARYFALHFCVPTFMLLKLKLPNTRGQAIDYIAETFRVTHMFAKKRLEVFENKVNSSLFFEELYKMFV